MVQLIVLLINSQKFNITKNAYLLKIGVAILLVYVGGKLMLHEWLVQIGFRPVYSLYIILIVLGGSIFLSMLFPKKSIHFELGKDNG